MIEYQLFILRIRWLIQKAENKNTFLDDLLHEVIRACMGIKLLLAISASYPKKVIVQTQPFVIPLFDV